MRYLFSLRVGAGFADRRAMLCATVVTLFGSISSATADEAEKRIERLVKQLGSESFDERETASKELVRAGESALPALRKATSSKDAELARGAQDCIQKIEHGINLRTLLQKLRSDNVQVRQNAVNVLIEFGPALREVVPDLVKLLDHPDMAVRIASAVVLCNAGPEAELALPKLLSILKDKSAETQRLRLRAMLVLEKMGPAGRRGVPILIEILETEEPLMRIVAALSLGSLCEYDPSAVPALLKALSQGDIEVRESAARALSFRRKEPEKVVGAILHILNTYPLDELDGAQLELKCTFVRCIKQYGALAQPALPYLIKEAKTKPYGSGDPRFGAEVAEALASIGPAAYKALPGLKELGPKPKRNAFYELIRKLDEKGK